MKASKDRTKFLISFTKVNNARQQQAGKLSIFTQFYPPDYAPTGQLIEELAIYLQNQEGLDVQVFTGQPGYAFRKDSAPTKELVKGVRIQRSRTAQLWPQRIRGKALNGLLFCLRSGLHLLKSSARGDILLLTTAPPYLPTLGLLANLCFGISYVCLLYDLYPDVAVELKVIPTEHWLTRIWNFVNYCTWIRAKKIVVLSPTAKDRILKKYPDLSDKITVIHNWGDPKTIKPIAKQDNWFAQKYHLVDKFTVLYSGNMGRCHDLETILAAARHLQGQPIQFVFIGNGAKYQHCIDTIEQLGLFNCLFLPYQDKLVLPYSLTACDLSLVSVSAGMEGIIVPSKLYGALAAGRPIAVICEPHSYLRQMLADGGCGRAFQNGDAQGLAEFICLLKSDRALAKQMGTAGRQYLKSNFTLEIVAQQYSQVLSLVT